MLKFTIYISTYVWEFTRVIRKIGFSHLILVKLIRILLRFIDDAFDCVHFTIQHSADRFNDAFHQKCSILLFDSSFSAITLKFEDISERWRKYPENCSSYKFYVFWFCHDLSQLAKFATKVHCPFADTVAENLKGFRWFLWVSMWKFINREKSEKIFRLFSLWSHLNSLAASPTG